MYYKFYLFPCLALPKPVVVPDEVSFLSQASKPVEVAKVVQIENTDEGNAINDKGVGTPVTEPLTVPYTTTKLPFVPIR